MMMNKVLIAIILVCLVVAGMLLKTLLEKEKIEKETYEPQEIKVIRPKLSLLSPKWTEVGKQTVFKVIDEKGNPVKNATIIVKDKIFLTNEIGEANFVFEEAGDYEIYAFKKGYLAKPTVIYQNNGDAEKFVAYLSEEGDKVVRPSNCTKPPCWGIKDGKIVIRKLPICLLPPIWIAENSSLIWEDYSIELDFRIISVGKKDTGFHVTFRDGRFGSYALGLNCFREHFLLEKKAAKKEYFPEDIFSWEPRKTVHILTKDVEIDNEWHHLKIIVSGNETPRIVAEYDGEKIINFTDEKHFRPISEGIFLLCICCDKSPPLEVMFDNITVKLLQLNESVAIKTIRVYPKGNEKIKLRVLKGAITEPAKKYYGDWKILGANGVEYRQDIYIHPETLEIITQPIDDIRESVIKHLHSLGLDVYFNPVFWGGDGRIKLEGLSIKSEEEKKEVLKRIEEYLIDRAKFAERNRVEFLFIGEVPYNLFRKDVFIDPLIVKWLEELPWKLKKYYSGKIVMNVQPTECHGTPLKCEYPGNFSGYDYISITIGWDFGLESGGNYEVHRLNVQEKIRAVLEKAREYNKKAFILLAADMNEKFVKEQMEKGLTPDEIRVKIFEIDFEEIMKHSDEIEGVFPHPVWEGAIIKIYRVYEVGTEIQHEKTLLFAYHGPAVEKLMKKYFTISERGVR
jgi:hypothetical protein